ncbi:MAG TPA: PepSY domain-containing protein [Polyangiaceae bacterium]|jgi:uncharacterized membrane protein YkoI
MNRLLYAIHKWLSAAAFVQFALWTVSGSVFAWVSQESIRSAPVEGANRSVLAEPPGVSIARAMEVAAAGGAGAVDRVELRGTPAGALYVVHGEGATVRVDARSGEVAPVSPAEAEAIARRDQPGSPAVAGTTLVEGTAPLEYRDCEHTECTMPAYRVALADAARTVLYIDAANGEVTARRNDRWRLYDFFWSLHIMDYRAREDFNHVLIRGASLLAVATVASGIVLLTLRATRWVRRRLARARIV